MKKSRRSKKEIKAMLKGLEIQLEYLWVHGKNQAQFDSLNAVIDVLYWTLKKERK